MTAIKFTLIALLLASSAAMQTNKVQKAGKKVIALNRLRVPLANVGPIQDELLDGPQSGATTCWLKVGSMMARSLGNNMNEVQVAKTQNNDNGTPVKICDDKPVDRGAGQFDYSRIGLVATEIFTVGVEKKDEQEALYRVIQKELKAGRVVAALIQKGGYQHAVVINGCKKDGFKVHLLDSEGATSRKWVSLFGQTNNIQIASIETVHMGNNQVQWNSVHPGGNANYSCDEDPCTKHLIEMGIEQIRAKMSCEAAGGNAALAIEFAFSY